MSNARGFGYGDNDHHLVFSLKYGLVASANNDTNDLEYGRKLIAYSNTHKGIHYVIAGIALGDHEQITDDFNNQTVWENWRNGSGELQYNKMMHKVHFPVKAIVPVESKSYDWGSQCISNLEAEYIWNDIVTGKV